MAKSATLLVAAIDFGTTYSGYAYSLRHDYKRDPLIIHTNVWTSSSATVSLKTPSAVLFKPDKSFASFGFEAEDRYIELTQTKEHKSWYYFSKFKMLLYNRRVSFGLVLVWF